ncbi:hypothetical protein V6Z12_D05G116300 [Gossypium hirsutum]
MESTMKISSSITFPINSTPKLHEYNKVLYWSAVSNGSYSISKISDISQMALLLMGCMLESVLDFTFEDVHFENFWNFFGDNPQCSACQAKGVVLCTTCAGSGLYVDSILESQGIIVKVRCLGCGGTGNVMCSECGGRGHRGPK